MCGICGEIRFDDQPADAQRLRAINDKMQARGPDDHGLYLHANRGFGHRRLKIMDLGNASQQPMVDPQLGLGIALRVDRQAGERSISGVFRSPTSLFTR